MAWGVGANDVANAMATSVGSRALTLKQAVVIAAIFEAAGSLFAGGQVADTLRSKIIDLSVFAHTPELVIYGMLAALLAAGTWLLLASYLGWPVSTTHSIVGAIIGFAVLNVGFNTVKWSFVVNIVLSWIITPLISAVFAFLLFKSIQIYILENEMPQQRAVYLLPIYIFVMVMVLSLVTLIKGLRHLGWHHNVAFAIVIATFVSLLLALASFVVIGWIQRSYKPISNYPYEQVERTFGLFMVFTAAAMAFAHGSNDVANAIGPLAAVVSIVNSGGDVSLQGPMPSWILYLGSAGIVLGLAMYGYKVIATIGKNITEMTPSRGFSAQFATAGTVVLASGTGLPVSTTQTLVGAVLGVGIARGIAALNLNVVRNILLSWVVTLPAGSFLAAFYFFIIRRIFEFGMIT